MSGTVHYLQLMLHKAYADLRAEATRAYLGFIWWFLEPAMYMLVFYLIVEAGLRRGGEGFMPFLLCGLVSWKWFASTVLSGADSLNKNAGIIQQVYVPKPVFPGVVILVNSFKFLIILAILLLLLTLGLGKPVTPAWLALPVVIAAQFLLITAVVMLLAAIIPFARDLKMLLENFIMMLFFMSGIFFDIGNIEPDIAMLLRLNPMVPLIDAYRTILLEGAWPHWGELLSVVGVALALGVPGLLLLRHFDRIYPKLVSK